MRNQIVFTLLLFVIYGANGQNQKSTLPCKIDWQENVKISGDNGSLLDYFSCRTCIGSNTNSRLPYFPVTINHQKISNIKLVNAIWVPLQFWEVSGIDTVAVSTAKSFLVEDMEQNRKMKTRVSVLSVRKNNSVWEKLNQFSIEVDGASIDPNDSKLRTTSDISHGSVFQAGSWLKISVLQTGVYQMSGNEIASNGLDLLGKNSSLIKMYGTGGKMLSEANKDFKFNDIPEIAIVVADGGDGIFDGTDRILFYGQEPNAWLFNQATEAFQFQRNLYSDTSFYFLTISEGPSLRVQNQTSVENPDVLLTSFLDRYVYAPENTNVLSAGREWYADVLDFNTSKDINFNVSNLDCDIPAKFRFGTMARSAVAYSFAFKVNGTQIGSITPPTVPISAPFSNFGADTYLTASKSLCNTNSVGVNITYNKSGNQQSIGYINFVEINAYRKLTWSNANFGFRSFGRVGQKVGYDLSGYPSDVQVWNVTLPKSASKIAYSGSSFALFQDTIQEFFAFKESAALSPVSIKPMANQNLQGMEVPDMVIVTNKLFLEQANRLANFRREQDTLTVAVVTPEQIYNEFSSGAQDVTSIRNLAMHLFYKDPNKHLKYLLLFGDCSYDYKNRISNNTNFTPTYEGPASLNIISSYSSDDYYGILSQTKGVWESFDLMDIGVGRLPSKNIGEAKTMVDKLIHYSSTAITQGNWRTRFTFVADDGDGCTHSSQANDLVKEMQSDYPDAIVKKIFLGAYNQVPNPGGYTSPDCTNDLLTTIEKGSLVINYTGHGGETVWADEFLFTSDMIAGLNNYDRLGFFVTATCDFGRHDYPSQVSGAESLLLNPNGGAVGIMTTGRPVNSYSNKLMNDAFYRSLITQRLGFTGRMGDVMRGSKNGCSDKSSNRGFTLLGDPSAKFALPKEEVVLTNFENDSIQGLQLVELSGEVRNQSVKDQAFNGTVFATVFDRPSTLTINDNEPGGSHCETSYPYLKNILYNGSVKVKDGDFDMKFFVSKDVSYQIGMGKINLYAMDPTRIIDAGGSKLNVSVGGINPNPIVDEDGPSIKLFMNDNSFLNYGLVGTDAHLIVYLEDSSGINTSGLGLGHDLMATLDNNEVYILNSYFQNEEGSYKKGSLSFPIRSLSIGLHSIEVKAWDNFNNSGTSTVWFEVGISSVNGKIVKEVNLFPNPFSDQIFISLENAYAGENVQISLAVFNITGALISEKNWSYENSIARPGAFNELAWDGKRDDGRKLPAGAYFCKIGLKSDTDGAEYKINKKIILLD